MLGNAPNISREDRIHLLARLKEKPPASVCDLIEMLKKAGAQKKKEAPEAKTPEKKRNEIKQTTLRDQINNHYGAGVSLLKQTKYEDARFEFERAVTILEELASTINASGQDANEDLKQLSASYIHISMQLLECYHARGYYPEAHELVNKLLESRLFIVPAEHQNVFRRWLLKYNAMEVTNSR